MKGTSASKKKAIKVKSGVTKKSHVSKEGVDWRNLTYYATTWKDEDKTTADMRDEYVNMSVNEQKRIREEVDIMKEFFTLCKKKEILMLKGGKVWNSLVRDCGTYECWNRCSCFVKPTALVQIRAAVSEYRKAKSINDFNSYINNDNNLVGAYNGGALDVNAVKKKLVMDMDMG